MSVGLNSVQATDVGRVPGADKESREKRNLFISSLATAHDSIHPADASHLTNESRLPLNHWHHGEQRHAQPHIEQSSANSYAFEQFPDEM